MSRRLCSTERVLVSNQTVIHRRSYQYNSMGSTGVQRLELGWDYFDQELDVNGDQNNRTFYYVHDIDGRQKGFDADNDDDGTIDWVRYHEHDDDGKLLYWIDDRDINTEFAWTHRANYTYQDGLLSRYQEVAYATPTTIYQRIDYVHVDGLLATVTRNTNPTTTGQECADWIENYVRDDDGKIIRLDLDGYINASTATCPNDRLDDGVFETVIFYDYDDQDRLIQRRYDALGDGSIERRETFTYDCETE
ncbi:MAG: hypothetical protein KJO07_08075 [Deltaproteobacteria bacterium]|nr:hypothetical protein [Deltaproteobacteria bacterium]